MSKEEHVITVKQLCRLIGYQGHNHAAIKEALRGLITTIIEWNLISDVTGAENWTASSIIASVSLEGPLCYYAYSPRQPTIANTVFMFGKIDLVIQSHFRSSYGLALYENCIRYRGLPNTKWFDMAMFKKLMGVTAGLYDVFRDFKRRVLDKAIDEVNMYSDLVITPEYVKEGRKVVKVRFGLKERPKKIRLGTKIAAETGAGPSTTGEALKSSLKRHFGLSEMQVGQLLQDYEAAFIQDKIKVIEASKPYRDGKVQNIAGYFISALKEDYQLPSPKTLPMTNLDEVKQEIELGALRRDMESLRQEYQLYRERAIYQAIETLPNKAKYDFMQQFRAYAEPAIKGVLQLQRNKYTPETVIESPQIKALLRQFAIRELDRLTLYSLEEYVAECAEEQQDVWQKLKACDPDNELLRVSE